jgi:hypothetical protein
VDLMGWAVAVVSSVDAPAAGWPQQTGEWRTAARQWLDAIATQALVPDGERHPNEQPGARMEPQVAQFVAAALEDMAVWGDAHADVVGGFEADGILAVVEEIRRRARFGHVGPNLARVISGRPVFDRESGDPVNDAARQLVEETLPPGRKD